MVQADWLQMRLRAGGLLVTSHISSDAAASADLS